MKMAKTVYITHSACLAHDVPEWHVELSERLMVMNAYVADINSDRLDIISDGGYSLANDADLELVHDTGYIQSMWNSVPEIGTYEYAQGTFIGQSTKNAVYASVGAVLHATENVINGKYKNAFCAIRPPGHHAGTQTATGFCLVNNIAIGAVAALERFGQKRIAIIDFDVHHGQGTQEIVEQRSDMLFASTHRSGIYPGTGYAEEVGQYNNIINLPYGYDLPHEDFMAFYTEVIFPRVREFRPDMIFVSAGFDAHRDDPLGNYTLTTGYFSHLMQGIKELSDDLCDGRLVIVLEGGYDTNATARCVGECLMVLT